MTKQLLGRNSRALTRTSGARPPLRSFRRPQIEPLEPRLVLASGFAPLPSEVTLLSGAPLHLGLDGFDDEGDALTFTASISNAQLANPTIANPELTASIPQGNRSMRISVDGFGDMVAELFEQRAPRTTSEIIELAQSGFYNDLIFHRIIQNFMIQGGDPLGDGTGGPGSSFDDEFNPDLQHTSAGVFSMAKSGDDTNGSQFFITAAPTRHLDYEHSIFGFLTEGESVRQAIAAVATDANDKPLVDVVMSAVEVFDDTENAVLMLSAPEGTTGEADVTVAVNDGAGGSADQTFHVVIEADTANAPPYLLPINPVETTIDTQATFRLEALDVEGNAIWYASFGTNNDNLELSVSSLTGVTTVTPKNGLVGVHGIAVGARRSSNWDGETWDTQIVPVYIAPNAPTGLELISGSAVGGASAATTSGPTGALHFRVSGLVEGAEVSLYAGDQLIGQATAQSASAVVETDPSFSWTDGVHTITAVQALRDQEVKIGNLDETVDLISPAAAPIELTVLSVDEGALLEHQAGSTAGPGPADFALAPGAPAGASIDLTTGQFAWQTTEPDGPGLYAIVIEVTQAGGGTKEPILVKVGEVNVPPAITPIGDRTGDQAVDEHVALLFDVLATDDDLPANTLSFDLGPGAPQGASIDPTTGRFHWTPGESQGGQQFAVTVRVWDEYGAKGEETFNVDVREVNDPPAFDPVNTQTVAPGEQLRVTVGARDTDDPAHAKPLLYSLDSGPEGASIDPATGEVTWDVPEQFLRDHDPADPVELTVRVTEDVGPGEEGLSVVETLKVMIEDPRPLLAFALTQMQTQADQKADQKDDEKNDQKDEAPMVPAPELPAALAPASVASPRSQLIDDGDGFGVFAPAISLAPGLGGSGGPAETESTEEGSGDVKDQDADSDPAADDQTDGDQGAALDVHAPSDQDPAGLSDAAIELLAAQEGPAQARPAQETESGPESPPQESPAADADKPQPSPSPPPSPAPEQVAAS